MPLHLLGKKSWNVYNSGNIEKVRRDEAAAAALEAAGEQQMQEVDAERRLRILRGDCSPLKSTEIALREPTGRPTRGDTTVDARTLKRKRRHGKDDTDADIRHACELQELARNGDGQRTGKEQAIRPASKALIIDGKGNINLFPNESPKSERGTIAGTEGKKNVEAEAEARKREREMEDQYTMRFSNAAGFKASVDEKPWYYSGEARSIRTATDREDDKRREARTKEKRERRMAADDPLAAITRGIQGVRKAEKSRKEWERDRVAEMRGSREDERKAAGRRRRREELEELEELDEANLNGFKLDGDICEARGRWPERQEPRKHRPEYRRKEDKYGTRQAKERRRTVQHECTWSADNPGSTPYSATP